ncbi:recombinase family protein [bacterium]|jgi:DNA invertase Pin-like site-specific DNA recombinase|nr:recombinase family protein [bacterium]
MTDTKTAIYARYSCDKQNETSLEDQIRRCKEIAVQHGLIVDEALIFTDSALSSREEATHKREGYRRFLKGWDAGEFTAFLVDEFSRLTREPVEQAVIMRKLDRNRRVRMITGENIDTNDADWGLRLGLQGVLAQQEIRKLQYRVRRGVIGQLERGYMIGSPAFGYEMKRFFDAQGDRIGSRWVVSEQNAAIVRKIYEQRESGQSMHEIAAWLNSQGIACSRKAQSQDGGYWRPSRVKNLLANTIYRGEFIWHGSTTHRYRANAIGIPVVTRSYLRPELRLVSDDTWHRCNTKSISRSGYGGGKNPLSGLLSCGYCGGTLVLTAQQRCRSLYCANCTVAKSSNAEHGRLTGTVAALGVQFLLREALKQFLTPEFQDAFRNSLRLRLTGDNQQEIEALVARLKKLQATQDRLSHMLADISQEDPVLMQRYTETRQKVVDEQVHLKSLETGFVAIDKKALQAQLQANPAKLLDGIFEAEVEPQRLRAMLHRLFPSITFEKKASRYTSVFGIKFSAGHALAIASSTETVMEDAIELRFQLKYHPSCPTKPRTAYWSVDTLDTIPELPENDLVC